MEYTSTYYQQLQNIMQILFIINYINPLLPIAQIEINNNLGSPA